VRDPDFQLRLVGNRTNERMTGRPYSARRRERDLIKPVSALRSSSSGRFDFLQCPEQVGAETATQSPPPALRASVWPPRRGDRCAQRSSPAAFPGTLTLGPRDLHTHTRRGYPSETRRPRPGSRTISSVKNGLARGPRAAICQGKVHRRRGDRPATSELRADICESSSGFKGHGFCDRGRPAEGAVRIRVDR